MYLLHVRFGSVRLRPWQVYQHFDWFVPCSHRRVFKEGLWEHHIKSLLSLKTFWLVRSDYLHEKAGLRDWKFFLNSKYLAPNLIPTVLSIDLVICVCSTNLWNYPLSFFSFIFSRGVWIPFVLREKVYLVLDRFLVAKDESLLSTSLSHNRRL